MIPMILFIVTVAKNRYPLNTVHVGPAEHTYVENAGLGGQSLGETVRRTIVDGYTKITKNSKKKPKKKPG